MSDDIHRNPSPPPNDNKEDVISDNVGNTTYSIQWILSTINNVVQKSMENNDKEDQNSRPEELDVELEEPLALIWDMSSDKDVAELIMEVDAPQIFVHLMKKSSCPRMNEILIGILANVCTNEDLALSLVKIASIREFIIEMLGNDDSLTLIQVIRLLQNLIEFDESRKIIENDINANNRMYECLTFILQSSVNEDLIHQTAKLLTLVMDNSAYIHCMWTKNKKFIEVVLEAFKELGNKENFVGCEYLCHLLYYVSCVNENARNLNNYHVDIIYHTLAFIDGLHDMPEIPSHMYYSIGAISSLLSTLIQMELDFVVKLNIGGSCIISKLIQILHHYIQRFNNKLENLVFKSILDLIANIIDSGKQHGDLSNSIFSQINSLLLKDSFEQSLHKILNLEKNGNITKNLKKMQERYSKDDYSALHKQLSLIH